MHWRLLLVAALAVTTSTLASTQDRAHRPFLAPDKVARGQAIAKHVVTASDGGEWREVGRGSTVGYTRLHRIEPTAIRRLRVTIEDAAAPPEPVVIKMYRSS